MSTLERIRVSQDNELRTTMPSKARYYSSGDFDIEEPVFTNTRTSRYAHSFTDNSELQKDIDKGNPDILPSGATMKMLNRTNAHERLFADDNKVAFKVNTKGKLYFALYAVAVLSLILVIVLNALAIERQKQENINISQQVAYLSSSVEDLKTQNENISKPEYIQDRAEELGMTKIDTEVIKVTPPTKATKAETKPSNWFDWLCDLFS